MEVVSPSDDPKSHKWLKWVGLQRPPLEPDSWVPVVRGLHIDQFKTGSSTIAAALVDVLGRAGLEARQRSYEHYYARVAKWPSVAPTYESMVTRVAVLVHERDRMRAIEIATEMNQKLEREQAQPLISDDELGREALAARKRPEA
jgi:hypothetical protein